MKMRFLMGFTLMVALLFSGCATTTTETKVDELAQIIVEEPNTITLEADVITIKGFDFLDTATNKEKKEDSGEDNLTDE